MGALHKPTKDELGDSLPIISIGEKLKYIVQKEQESFLKKEVF